MKIGLVGFGKAGMAVASVILATPDMDLEWVVRKSDKLELRSVSEFLGVESNDDCLIYPVSAFHIDELLDIFPVDVIIDFSSEDAMDYYGASAASRGTVIVTAISHLTSERQHQLHQLSTLTPVLWSPNITVGINFLILAAQTLRRIAPYVDIEIVEEHFKAKAGVSGTANIIAESLDVDPLNIKSIRAGGIVGVHEVVFGFPQQTVRIRHESITREAFGHGALFVAERLVGMPPGLYKMDDLLLPYFGTGHSAGEVAVTLCEDCHAKPPSLLPMP